MVGNLNTSCCRLGKPARLIPGIRVMYEKRIGNPKILDSASGSFASSRQWRARFFSRFHEVDISPLPVVVSVKIPSDFDATNDSAPDFANKNMSKCVRKSTPATAF